MTDEEKMAMEITNGLDTMVYDDEGSCVNIYDNIERAVLVGIRAGKPKWHDLIKNPDDLPKEVTNVLFVLSINIVLIGWRINDTWITDVNNKVIPNDSVIAWCELPKFEVEK